MQSATFLSRRGLELSDDYTSRLALTEEYNAYP
jgi:L-rhamnose isomerase